MWISFLKKNSTNTNFILESSFDVVKKKQNLFDNEKTKTIIDNFNFFKNLITPFKNIYDLNQVINIYVNFLKSFANHSLQEYNTIILVNLKKKQVFTHLIFKKKLLKVLSNGILMKKLNILKKSQKKDLKLSILNVKNILSTNSVKISKNLILNIVGMRFNVLKIINALKSDIKNKNILYFYTPLYNFSKKKFKKIKSIKRKLKKKYVSL